MKKIISVLLVLLVLCGCGNGGTAKVSDGDTVLVANNSESLTKEDLFEMLKTSEISDIESDIYKRIAETYDIDVESIESEIDSYISMYEAMGYSSYIEYYYGSIAAYRATMIDAEIYDELGKIYIKENLDTVTAGDDPVQLQLMSFETEDEAKAFIEDINNGSTFDMAAINAGAETAPTATVYTVTDDLDEYIWDYIDNTDKLGVSTIITSTTTSTDENGDDVDVTTYYVVNIVSRDVNDFMDEYLDAAVNNLDQTTTYQYFLTKHNVKIYDQDLYDDLAETYEVGH